MKTTNYAVIAIITAFSFATSMAQAGTKRINKGRSGYGYVNVPKKEVRKNAEKPAKTIGLFVGDKKKTSKKRVFVGGRRNGGFKSIPRR